jgi:hypothetical protein
MAVEWTRAEYMELELYLDTDLSGVFDTADLMEDTHSHANNRFFDEWKDIKERMGGNPGDWEKLARRKEREGRYVHREHGSLSILRTLKRFNPLQYLKYGINKDDDPCLRDISLNLMFGYYANYNKGNRLAAQLLLGKSERLTDPKEKAKVKRQAIRLDQRILEGMAIPTECLDSDDESYDSKESSEGITWYEEREFYGHGPNPMLL